MTREEAIDIVRKNYPHVGFSGSQFETALRNLIPELRESEDEMIRKAIVHLLKVAGEKYIIEATGFKKEQCLAYLEKLFESGKGLYYYDGEKTTYMGCPATEENPYDFAMKQQEEKQKEQSLKDYIDDFPYNDQKEQKPAEWEDIKDKVNIPYCSSEQEWGEEDKAIVGCIAVCLDGQFVTEAARKQCLEWFNKHRRDFLNQPKQEWSEEDEMIRNAILGFLNPDKGGTKYSSNAELVEWSNWLKSLRPQPHWKPSEEQLNGLAHAINLDVYDAKRYGLDSLYSDLKKLM